MEFTHICPFPSIPDWKQTKSHSGDHKALKVCYPTRRIEKTTHLTPHSWESKRDTQPNVLVEQAEIHHPSTIAAEAEFCLEGMKERWQKSGLPQQPLKSSQLQTESLDIDVWLQSFITKSSRASVQLFDTMCLKWANVIHPGTICQDLSD